MQKDRSYHEAAIMYNEELADCAESLTTRLQHEEVQRWSRSVAKQHRFHAGRHKRALQKLESQGAQTVSTEDGGEDVVVDDERIVHRSADTGEFVTEKFAEHHPRTTEAETVDVPSSEGLTETEMEADRNAAQSRAESDNSQETPQETADRLREELNDGTGI